MDRFEKRDTETRQRLASERIGQLEYALVKVAASLAAAISLLERTPQAKKAAPSDKMFAQMIVDYKKALETGRGALVGYSVTVTNGDER